MAEFLKLVAPFEAWMRLLQALPDISAEEELVDVLSAVGRVTAQDVRAPHALPSFSRSSMDGFRGACK